MAGARLMRGIEAGDSRDRGRHCLLSLVLDVLLDQLVALYAFLAHRSMGRKLKELKSGKLAVDKAKVKNAGQLDGKYLLSISDKSLSAKDVAWENFCIKMDIYYSTPNRLGRSVIS